MSRTTVLVTGGSGFLGINLCRYLLARGYPVRTLDIAPFDYPERDRVEAILGDVRDPSAVNAATRGAAMVVHAAAALPLSSEEQIYTTDAEGTRVVLECAFRNEVARVVFISSTSVYGIPDHHPLCEDDELHGVGPYGAAKIRAERYCHDFRLAGHCVPVLRPKSFVGPERLGVFELLYDWAAAGRNFPVLGTGDNLYQLLDVEDLCEVIYRCMTFDADRGNTAFNVGARQFGTMRQNFQAVLDRAGFGKKVVGLPEKPAILALRLLAALRLSPIYQWIYASAARESFVSIDRLQRRLDYVPRYSNEQALLRNFEWYLRHRGEYRGRTGVSHRVPWKRGALRLAEMFF